jgi:hypothetical protein
MKGRNLRAAMHVSAVFATWLAVLMLVPALADLYYGNPDWIVFAISSAVIAALAIIVAAATRGIRPAYSTRFAFLQVNLLWLTFAVAGAVPFVESSLQMTLADAFFESMSGITTTGSTVISGLDHLPPGLLLWRSILQWVGGLGVIVLGMFILPYLKIGGSSVFKLESSDRYDRPFSRLTTFARSIVAIYVTSTLVCALLYAMTGMTGFDAVNHAMTTVSTGGYSTHDASFAYFDNLATQWVAIVFMLIGATPFTALVVLMLKGRLDTFPRQPGRRHAGLFARPVGAGRDLSRRHPCRGAGARHRARRLQHRLADHHHRLRQLRLPAMGPLRDRHRLHGDLSRRLFRLDRRRREGLSLDRALRHHAPRARPLHLSERGGQRALRQRHGDEETLDIVLLFFTAFILLWSLLDRRADADRHGFHHLDVRHPDRARQCRPRPRPGDRPRPATSPRCPTWRNGSSPSPCCSAASRSSPCWCCCRRRSGGSEERSA